MPSAARVFLGVPLRAGLLWTLESLALGFGVTIAIGVAIMLAIVMITGNAPSVEPGRPLNSLLLVGFYAVSGGFAASRLRKARIRVFRRPDARDARALAIGAAALIAAHLIAGVGMILAHQAKHVQAGFEHFSVASGTHGSTLAAVLMTVATLVLVAPVVEEMIFRALLFGALAPRTGTLAAAAISAVLFGLLHGDPVLFPLLAGLGFINALAYAVTRNLLVPVALHALNNAFATALLVSQSLGGYKM